MATKILITGATDGIGKHTATLLAQKKGYQLLLHGRDPSRLDACVQDIQQHASAPVLSYCADFESLDQVRDMAKHVAADHSDGVHVLVNNAGVYSPAKHTTADGMEATWQVNVVAPFLLTHMLLPTLRARVVNVASISAASSLDFDNLNQEKGYSAHGAYSASKIAMQMFTYALARRLRSQGSSLTANCLDPGTVNTKSTWCAVYTDVLQTNHAHSAVRWLGSLRY